jgi:hypothetical protein
MLANDEMIYQEKDPKDLENIQINIMKKVKLKTIDAEVNYKNPDQICYQD